MEEELLSIVNRKLEDFEARVKDVLAWQISEVNKRIDELAETVQGFLEAWGDLEKRRSKLQLLETAVNDLLNYYKELKDQINRLSLRLNLLQANIAKHSRTTGGRPNED